MSDADVRATVSRVMRGLNHDLKNPLGAADGYLDLLLQGYRGELTPEQRQTLERVRALIASGITILEDVVAYTRASIGELRTNPSDSELKAVVRMTMERHAARAASADVALGFEAPDEPVRAATDAEMVGQIVDHMLANALDHAPDGGRVDVSVRPDGDHVVIRVRDSGTGVAEADRDRVFEAFEKGGVPARTRESAGIGLGLALGRALGQQLGGDLTLDDGDGSSFSLRIPRARG